MPTIAHRRPSVAYLLAALSLYGLALGTITILPSVAIVFGWEPSRATERDLAGLAMFAGLPFMALAGAGLIIGVWNHRRQPG